MIENKIESDKESNDGHVDNRSSNFECKNPDTHLGCYFGIDVAGQHTVWMKMESRASLRL